MFYVVEIDGIIRSLIDTTGKANKYGKPKLFKTEKDAEAWIARRTYKGMTHKYEIHRLEADVQI